MNAAQCRMARGALELGVRELAAAARVSTNTIVRLEAGQELKPRTIDAIRAALEAAGVEFIGDGGGLGVRLRLPDSYSDGELVNWLDSDGQWSLKGKFSPLPPQRKTLRGALRQALDLQSSSQEVTSIASIPNRIIVPLDQIRRLWAIVKLDGDRL
jgi:transcriptional regulator with XRE-family HTH domain